MKQCFHNITLVATRGFHHDELGTDLLHLFHQLCNVIVRVAKLLYLPFPQHCNIQPTLRHIDPYIATRCHLFLLFL
jgi:hypothetical protein